MDKEDLIVTQANARDATLIAEAKKRTQEILDKHKRPEKKKQFEITTEMRREAEIKSLQDGDLNK